MLDAGSVEGDVPFGHGPSFGITVGTVGCECAADVLGLVNKGPEGAWLIPLCRFEGLEAFGSGDFEPLGARAVGILICHMP